MKKDNVLIIVNAVAVFSAALTVIKLVNDKNQTLKDVWIIYDVNKGATDQSFKEDSIVNVFEANTSHVDALYAMIGWITEGGLVEDGLTFNFLSTSPLSQTTALLPQSNDQDKQQDTLPTSDKKNLLKVEANIYTDKYESYQNLKKLLSSEIKSTQKTIEIDKNLSSVDGLDIRCFRASLEGPLFVKISHGQLSALIVPNFNFNTLTSLKKIPQQQAIKTTLLINQNINTQGKPQQQIVHHLDPSYIFINGGYFDQKNNQESMSYIKDYFAWKTDSKGWINPKKDILHFMSHRDDAITDNYINKFNQTLQGSDALKVKIEATVESAFNKKDIEQVLGFYKYNNQIYDLRLTNLPVYSTYTQGTTVFSWNKDATKPIVDATDYSLENTLGLLQQNAQSFFNVTTLGSDIQTREEKTNFFLSTINDSLALLLKNKTINFYEISGEQDYYSFYTLVYSLNDYANRRDVVFEDRESFLEQGRRLLSFILNTFKETDDLVNDYKEKIQGSVRSLQELFDALPDEFKDTFEKKLEAITDPLREKLDKYLEHFKEKWSPKIQIGGSKTLSDVRDKQQELYDQDNLDQQKAKKAQENRNGFLDDSDDDDDSNAGSGLLVDIRNTVQDIAKFSIAVIEPNDSQVKKPLLGVFVLSALATSNIIGLSMIGFVISVMLLQKKNQSDTSNPLLNIEPPHFGQEDLNLDNSLLQVQDSLIQDILDFIQAEGVEESEDIFEDLIEEDPEAAFDFLGRALPTLVRQPITIEGDGVIESIVDAYVPFVQFKKAKPRGLIRATKNKRDI